MNQSTLKVGIVSGICVIFFTIFFLLAIMVVPPVNYISILQYQSAYSTIILLPVIPSFLLVLANLPLIVTIYFRTNENNKSLAFTGLLFGAGYAVCSGINYFAQLTVVSTNLLNGNGETMVNFIMSNKMSFTASLDQLGYLFLSFAFLFFSGLFSLRGLEGYIKSIFIIYGISGLTGCLGYILGSPILESMVLVSAFPYLAGIILLVKLNFREYRLSRSK
jgi:hypothetical protein